jgi:hypothetical protein
MQAHTRDPAIRGNQWRSNDRRNRRNAVMLQYNHKRMLSATDRIWIFGNVKLLKQSELSHPVGPQAVLFNEFVNGVDCLFVFLIPLTRCRFAIRSMQLGEPAAQRLAQKLGKINPSLFSCGERFSIKFDRNSFIHGSAPANGCEFSLPPEARVTPCHRP